MARILRLGRGGFWLLCISLTACGGGGGGGSSSASGSSGSSGAVTPTSNVVSVSVSAGPAGVNAINTLYTTVTVCVPGTTTCQTIDNIQVDTGSYGLRLLSDAVSLTLPVATLSTGGGALVECTEFVDGYSWGPVALVDLQISGETANSIPVQLIGDSRYPTAPTDCSTGAPSAENTVGTFGANGVLGIGPFAQDCGAYCAGDITEPIQYYACSTSVECQGTLVPVTAQVQNPVSMFTTDNNGSIISLPSVASSGSASVSGSLIFGIDTESNNASGTESVVPINDMGYVTTVFNGSTLSDSFVDSGSNATYFDDSNITQCPSSGSGSTTFSTFYCPSSPVTLTAAFELANDSTVSENFEVENADSISETVTAFPGLAGTNPTSSSFDWGLPFFFGRRVATAIEGAATSVGTGPYIAF